MTSLPPQDVPDDVTRCLALARQLADAIKAIEAEGAVVSASHDLLHISWPASASGTYSSVQLCQPVSAGRNPKPRRWEVTTTWRNC